MSREYFPCVDLPGRFLTSRWFVILGIASRALSVLQKRSYVRPRVYPPSLEHRKQFYVEMAVYFQHCKPIPQEVHVQCYRQLLSCHSQSFTSLEALQSRLRSIYLSESTKCLLSGPCNTSSLKLTKITEESYPASTLDMCILMRNSCEYRYKHN
jgi:hypothetical protein